MNKKSIKIKQTFSGINLLIPRKEHKIVIIYEQIIILIILMDDLIRDKP